MIRFRPLPVMSVLAFAALLVLLAFGRWQWDKYVRASDRVETPLLEVTLADYQPLPEGLQLVFGVVEGEPGWRVMAPVRTGERIVFVDAAFDPGVEPPDWRTMQPPGALSFGEPVQGLAVPGVTPGPMTPASVPSEHVWHVPDLQGMAAAIAPLADGAVVETETFVAIPYVGFDGRAVANPFAVARRDRLPPEQHLGYALTWWGLAAALVAIYFAVHVNAGRLRFGRGGG